MLVLYLSSGLVFEVAQARQVLVLVNEEWRWRVGGGAIPGVLGAVGVKWLGCRVGSWEGQGWGGEFFDVEENLWLIYLKGFKTTHVNFVSRHR